MVTRFNAPTARSRASSRDAERSAPRLRALRGATVVAADDPALIAAAVRELLLSLVRANAIAPNELLSVIFSATADLHSVYPAAAARELGWTDVPMLCVAEMDVAGGLPRCVRVLVHLSLNDDRPLHAVYLHEARTLRPDLAEAACIAS
jgi:chorismate mutase